MSLAVAPGCRAVLGRGEKRKEGKLLKVNSNIRSECVLFFSFDEVDLVGDKFA